MKGDIEFMCFKKYFSIIAFFFVAFLGVLISPQSVYAVAPAPSWWNGTTCDTANHVGSYALGTYFNGVAACGPGPAYQGGTDVLVRFFQGAWGEYEWECVELSMRYMYLVYGINPYNSSGGKDVVPNYSGSRLTKVNNNGLSLPTPGDVISVGATQYNQYGHTSIVTGVNVINGSGTISVLEQNGPANSNGSGSISVSNNILGGNVTSWLHDPNYISNFSGAIDSIVTPDGITHVFKGTTDGRILEIFWGNGTPLTQWTPANNLGGSVTSVSSQIENGVQHVYASVGQNVWEIAWGNGAPLTQWMPASNLGSAVSGMSTRLTNGVAHIFVGIGSSIKEIAWGNGTPLTQWTPGNNFGGSVTSVSSQIENGVQHVYISVGQSVWEVAWGNGTPLTQWMPASNLGSAVSGMSTRLTNGVAHIFVGIGSSIKEISWGNGNPLTQWTPGNNFGGSVTSLSSQIENGVQHVYVGVGSSIWEVAWGNGAPLTQWMPGGALGGTVSGISAQLMNGVSHVFVNVGQKSWEVYWGNGSPLTQRIISTGV